MALENLEPATRIEAILDGEDIAPATRLEYFLAKAAEGGGGGDIGKYVKVYDSIEILSEPIQVVSDIDGTVIEYTSGKGVYALDDYSDLVICRLADTPVVTTPVVMIANDGVKTALYTVAMGNNVSDIKPFVIPTGADSEPAFYVKEILPDAKIAFVSPLTPYSNNIILVDVNYVTLGYGYTGTK